MTKEQKDVYNARAKGMPVIKKEEKYDTRGVPLSWKEKEEQRKKDMKRQAFEQIEEMVSFFHHAGSIILKFVKCLYYHMSYDFVYYFSFNSTNFPFWSLQLCCCHWRTRIPTLWVGNCEILSVERHWRTLSWICGPRYYLLIHFFFSLSEVFCFQASYAWDILLLPKSILRPLTAFQLLAFNLLKVIILESLMTSRQFFAKMYLNFISLHLKMFQCSSHILIGFILNISNETKDVGRSGMRWE